jgi:hypothetical protein
MTLKVIFGLIGMALLIAFVAPVLVKLKSAALAIVILIGVGMMAYDFWEFLRERD